MYASYSTQALVPLPTLIAGDFPRVTRKVTVAASAGGYPGGAMLGQITASTICTLSLAAAGDGSEDIFAVLAEPVAASADPQEAIVYLSGDFHADALTFGDGHTADSARGPLRRLSIFI